MVWVDVGDAREAREFLLRTRSHLFNNTASVDDVNKVDDLIQQIDNLRPLGPDGEHGNRHTSWCGCIDTPFKKCKNCAGEIIYGGYGIGMDQSWFHTTTRVRPCHPRTTYAEPEE